jgi:hypothetical protein
MRPAAHCTWTRRYTITRLIIHRAAARKRHIRHLLVSVARVVQTMYEGTFYHLLDLSQRRFGVS